MIWELTIVSTIAGKKHVTFSSSVLVELIMANIKNRKRSNLGFNIKVDIVSHFNNWRAKLQMKIYVTGNKLIHNLAFILVKSPKMST